METEYITIGELARQVGLRTSALRFYEEQRLLFPARHTESGYRQYSSDAIQVVKFIKRAQQLGFSLADIRVFLNDGQRGHLDAKSLLKVAQERYLSLERDITRLFVLQHELGLFLMDLYDGKSPMLDPSLSQQWSKLLDHVCSNPYARPISAIFDWLIERTGCVLSSQESQVILDSLRGQHVHIWQEGDGYFIFFVSEDKKVGQALQALANMEINCQVHTHPNHIPELLLHEGGYLLITHGENAFIFARLFLMISSQLKVSSSS